LEKAPGRPRVALNPVMALPRCLALCGPDWLAGCDTGSVPFVADDLGAWLVALLADAGRKKLTALVLGDDQERALRMAATAAVLATTQELCPGGGERAQELAMVVTHVFSQPVPGAPLTDQATILEGLQKGIAAQLTVLDDASLTGTGQSSAEVLGIPVPVLTQTLTDYLTREILARGSRGGPLFALADQLNHDVTHLQGQRLEGMLAQLVGEVRDALPRHGYKPIVTAAGNLGQSGNTTSIGSSAGPVIQGRDNLGALSVPGAEHTGKHQDPGHVFISYVREDSPYADRLQHVLEAAGVPVWRDTADLWPGENWQIKIRHAITENALVFIACFSANSLARRKSWHNEELVLAIEQLRQRNPDEPWLIPVRFDDCDIPDRDIGGGRTLASIQRADLFGDRYQEAADRLITIVLRILGLSFEHQATATAGAVAAHSPLPQERGAPHKAVQAFLRRQLPDFLGREHEVLRITEMLQRREQTSPVVVLYGMGGVGKTTIANELAHRLGEDFPVTRIFVDLGGTGQDEASSSSVFQQIFYVLGTPEAEIPKQAAQQTLLLQRLLARRPCLLILDNAARAEQVATLLPSGPGSAVIVTSRSPLRSLDGARRVNVQPLASHSALNLFRNVLGEDYGPVEPTAAARIVDLTAGLPLAIRIAAAAAASPAVYGQPLSVLAEQLASASERLGALEDDERGIRASFDISYRALPSDAAGFFRVLGLLPVAEADLALAAAAADVTSERARELASVLIDAQLLDTVGQFGQRYRMHDLVQLYAREAAVHAEGGQSGQLVLDRVFDWYIEAAERTLAPPSTGHHPSAEALLWFAREHANALTVTRTAYEAEDWNRVQKLSEALRPLLWYRKRWEELALTEDWAVQAARRNSDGRSEIQAIIYLAEVRRGAGRSEYAASLYERALQISRSDQDRGLEAWITTHYGDSFLELNRPEEAIEYYEKALLLFRSVSDEGGELWLAAHFIDGYLLAGRVGDAVQVGEEALALARRRNDQSAEIWVRWHLALAYRDAGRFSEAIEGFQAAVIDGRTRRDLGATTHMLMLLGETQQEAGLHAEAGTTLNEALRLAQGVGIEHLENRIAGILAKLTGAPGIQQSPQWEASQRENLVTALR